MFLLVTDRVCCKGSSVKHSQCFNWSRSLSHIKCFIAKLYYTQASQRHLWTLLHSDMKWSQKSIFDFMGMELFIVWKLLKSCRTPGFKAILQMLISLGIFGTLKKIADDFYILCLTFFFSIWKTCTVSSVKGMCGVCGLCCIHAMVRRETLFIVRGDI